MAEKMLFPADLANILLKEKVRLVDECIALGAKGMQDALSLERTLHNLNTMYRKAVEARALLALYRARHEVDGRGHNYDAVKRAELDKLIERFEAEVSRG